MKEKYLISHPLLMVPYDYLIMHRDISMATGTVALMRLIEHVEQFKYLILRDKCFQSNGTGRIYR